jgi:hypothetical protein
MLSSYLRLSLPQVEEKRLLGNYKIEGEDKIKMDFKGTEYEDVGYTDFAEGTL